MGGFKRNGNNSNFTRTDRRDSDMPVEDIIYSGVIYKECENDLVIKSQLENVVPYFNGRIFLENKKEVGKVDEILGKVSNYYFSVRLKDGIMAKSFSKDTKFYIDSAQTLPISRFISQPTKKVVNVKKKKKNNRDKQKGNVESAENKKSGNSGFRDNNRGNIRGGFKNHRGGRGNNTGNSGRREYFNNRNRGNNRFGNRRGRF